MALCQLVVDVQARIVSGKGGGWPMEQGARLILDVGGVVIAINSPVKWLTPLEARYAGYLTNDSASWQVTLDYDWHSDSQGFIGATHDGPVTRFAFPAYGGWIDLANRMAVVSISSDAYALHALHRLLVYVCMQVLPQERAALLLHASGVIRRGAGHVFVGPSGAGKTTIAHLAAGYGQVLCDENVVVRIGSDGPEVLGTPFWGSGTPTNVSTRVESAAPLRAIYILAHTVDFQLTRLTAGHAVLALLESERVPLERPDTAATWLAVAERLVSKAPVYGLGFRPTTQLWSFLDHEQDVR